MSPPMLLFVYAITLVLASLAGGKLPERVAMTHTRTQMVMSLVSGLMLGIAFFQLLPHAMIMHGDDHGLNSTMGWVVLGLITMLLLLRVLHFHQPDYAVEATHGGDEPYPPHEHHPVSASAAGVATASWKGMLVGLMFHTFIDGVALGAALLAAPHGHVEQLLGFGVFLAILLHKPLDAMSITALMKAAGTSAAARLRANLSFALVCPLGAALFHVYALGQGEGSAVIVAAALAFSAGAFMCIALSDLLPEVQFHSHDRVKLTLLFLFGIGLSYLMANTATEHSHDLPSSAPTREKVAMVLQEL